MNQKLEEFIEFINKFNINEIKVNVRIMLWKVYMKSIWRYGTEIIYILKK